ncbi:MAG: hypothetical protein U9O65_02190, partial [Thermotogota bacterium]|nr:hypothetical protein [Thermotogota bacterium]
KVFYNIVNFLNDATAKMLDVDTKDIRFLATEGNYYYPWIMGKEFRLWMKDKYFGRQLNEYVRNWAKYGDLWVKKVKNDVKWVPPQNMIYRVNAVDYKTIPLIEKHEYGFDELRVVGKQNGWSDVDKVIEKAVDERITIYECYFPDGYLDDESNYFIIPKGQSLILAEDKRDCPYKKLAWDKIPGRLAGRGIFELNFEEQIYLNRMANYKSEGFHWTSKHHYQTSNPSIGKNLNLATMANGSVVITNSPIQPIANEERNLSAYVSDESRWEENAMKKSFTREPITGGRAPSGTPLGSTILQSKMASSFFEQRKEDLSSFLKEIIFEWILPDFKDQKRKEHKILMRSIMDDEDSSEKFFQIKLNEKMNELKLKSKHLTPEQWKIRRGIQAELLSDSEINLPEGFYNNLKYKIDITIIGEQIDTSSKIGIFQMISQMLASNPALLQDKRIKKMIYKMLDAGGINPHSIFSEDVPSIAGASEEAAPPQRGGSMARIAPMSPIATATKEV